MENSPIAHSPSVRHIMQYMAVCGHSGQFWANAEKVKMQLEEKLSATNISRSIIKINSFTHMLVKPGKYKMG